MWNPSASDQPRRIGSILRGAGPSGALATKARVLVRLERTVHRILGETSASHVRAGGVSPDTLTLLADSPAWATITRFRIPEIREAVRAELPHIRDARVILDNPQTPAGPRSASEPRTLSPLAARVLRSVARSVDNPRLSRVLMRLAARERPPAGPGSASESPSSGFNRR